MYDYDLKEKPETKRRGHFPYFAVGSIIVGAVILIVGIIYYKRSDMTVYYRSSMTEVSEVIDGGKISSVDIDVSAGDIFVGRSDDGQVHLTGNVPKDYVLKESGGRLRIGLSQNFQTKNIFDINKNQLFDWDTIDAQVYLPDKAYDEFICNVGAGEVTIEGIECKKAKISTGAGEIAISDMICNSVLKADTGAGEIDITNAVTGGLDLDVGAGEIKYSGEVNGDIDADCGVGSCQIDLTNSEEAYNKKYTMDTDVGLGEIKVSYGN